MRDRRSKHRRLLLFLSVALTGVLLVACGAENPTGKTTRTRAGVVSGTTATIGMKLCTSCHSQQTEEWLTSKHANVEPLGNLYSAGIPTMGELGVGDCVRCHDPEGDSGQLIAGYTGNTVRPVVGCESCHGGGDDHYADGGVGYIGFATLPAQVIGTTSTIMASAQFRTCTSCHELLDPDDPASATTATTSVHDPLGAYPLTSGESITDTHFATPGYWASAFSANTNTITGYAMDYSSEKVCTDCHDPHKNPDINREWASSEHADRTPGGAWAHYNWSCDSSCFGSSGDRSVCQRCHTTTGFASYASALQRGDNAAAEAIRTGTAPAVTPQKTTFKPEMLKCNGCHTDNRGTLRNPGAYKATYEIGSAPNASVTYQYPDLGASNVCMTCHTGRVSGKAIAQLNTGQTATVDFSSFSYVDGHYLTAGGTMFKGPAFEYAGRSYTDPSTFMHKDIGTSAAPGTGTHGPCIGCHMDRTGQPGNHTFEPVNDVSGTMVVTSEVCFKCHAGSSIDFGSIVEEEKDNFEFALEALEDTLLNSTPSYSFVPDYPYFTNSDWLIFGDTDVSGNAGGKNTLGAVFNFSLLHHEPGAFVHNSRYVKRIIYDSIDWMDDGQMDYSVGTTLAGVCASPQPWCAGAQNYLLYGAPNTSGERP